MRRFAPRTGRDVRDLLRSLVQGRLSDVSKGLDRLECGSTASPKHPRREETGVVTILHAKVIGFCGGKAVAEHGTRLFTAHSLLFA